MITHNSTYSISYTTDSILIAIASICIVIGTYFALLHVIRIFQQLDLQSPFFDFD
jgi:hypothetical protein